MAIRIGSGDNLKRLYLGEGSISEVYLGTVLIWSENLAPSVTFSHDQELSISANTAYTINFTITEQDETDYITAVTLTGPSGFTPPTYTVTGTPTSFSGSFTIPATLFTTGGTPADGDFTVTATDSNGGTTTETLTINNVNKAQWNDSANDESFNATGGAQTFQYSNEGNGTVAITSNSSDFSVGTFGDDSTAVAITAVDNSNSCNSNAGTLTIRKGTLNQDQFVDTVVVTQAAGLSGTGSFSSGNATVSSTTTSYNFGWSGSGSGSNQCNVLSSGGFITGVSNSGVVSFSQNTGDNNRSGSIRCRRSPCVGYTTRTLTQLGSPQEISVSDVTNINAVVSGNTNVPVTQSGPSTPTLTNVPSWATPIDVNAGNSFFTFTIANNTGCQRSQTITATKGSASDTFTLGQNKRTAVLSASTVTSNMSPAAGTLTSSLSHSGCGNLVITSSQPSWLTCNNDGGHTVTQNTGPARSGVCSRQKINTVDNGVEITRNRTVNQSAGAASITSINGVSSVDRGVDPTFTSTISTPLSQTVSYKWTNTGSFWCSISGSSTNSSVVVNTNDFGAVGSVCAVTLTITDQYGNTDSQEHEFTLTQPQNTIQSCTIVNESTGLSLSYGAPIYQSSTGFCPSGSVRFQSTPFITVNLDKAAVSNISLQTEVTSLTCTETSPNYSITVSPKIGQTDSLSITSGNTSVKNRIDVIDGGTSVQNTGGCKSPFQSGSLFYDNLMSCNVTVRITSTDSDVVSGSSTTCSGTIRNTKFL